MAFVVVVVVFTLLVIEKAAIYIARTQLNIKFRLDVDTCSQLSLIQ